MNLTSLLLICVVLILSAQADVRTSFSNVGPVDSGTFRSATINDTITLAYSIDKTGAVSLNASTTNSNATFVNLVNQFDRPNGTAGSTTHSAFFQTSFSLKIIPKRPLNPNLCITTVSGGGLGIEGQDSNRVDGRTLTTSAPEALHVELTAPAGMLLQFQSWSWVSGTGADMRFSNGTDSQDFINIAASGSSHFDLVTNALSLTSGDTLIFGETPSSSNGATLAGFAFDILSAPATANDVVVSFANSGNGFGPSPPFVTANDSTASILLRFSINGAGVISLDASTTSSNAVFSAIVAEWDNANVGSVADPSLFGKSFTLTGTQSGGANLTISELGGGGIGIQGENSNRIDGLNYGTGDTTSTPETLTWTLTAPAGLELFLQSWSYVEGSGGDIRVTSGATNQDFTNMSAASGTLALTNLSLTNGQSLTFKEIPGVGSTTGAGVAGFRFAVTTPAAAEGFDNGALNNLWTNPINWNPNGIPAFPADAIIDGYEVILNSTASASPDELRIVNGSLTVTGTGALSMRAMTIGRDLTQSVRLTVSGSGASFRYSGSSATDEFVVGSAATVETKPDGSGCEPLELGPAKLVMDLGSQWVLDGSQVSGPYQIGDRFVLANFGSFAGSTSAFRTRHFDLPSDRRLELISTANSIYYEVKAQTPASGPNIIIINTDDQAADQHFGFDGRNCITPTLDALVANGVKFNLAFCASSVCGASRYSLLTSRWPSRNTSDTFLARYPLGTLGRFGVSDTELEHDGQNLGAWLQKAGYRTGFVGKSHVLDDELGATANWTAKGLITYSKTADPATDATVNGAMQHNHRVVCQNMRMLGFDYVDGFYHGNLKELWNDQLNVHNQEWITSRALRFIEENRNERFFLYMAPTINHGPVNNNLDFTLRANNGYTSAGYLPNEDYSFMPTRASIISQVQSAGKDLITARETWLDHSVKAIIDKLTAYGIRNDTLIIFTSDHGEKTLSSPTIWGKTSLYDLGLKVPLVMSWPNGITNPGRSYNELVSHVDIGTTLLALAGASDLPTRAVDGVTLVPVLQGSSAPVRSDVFSEIGYARAVRTKTRKYIAVRYTPSIYSQIENGFRWPEYNANAQLTGGTIPRPYYINNSGLGAGVAATNPTYFEEDQLYNLSNDPEENTNIYGLEPAMAYQLKKRLASYIGSIPHRPFRQFADTSTEFSPSPHASPPTPDSLRMTFNNLNEVKLQWSDAASSELGYVIRKIVNGGTPQIIGEYPSGTTDATVALDPGISDILLQVASYNAQGDAVVNQDLLSPEPWRYRTFGKNDPALSQPGSQWGNDADGDGVTTLWEYAAGTDPLSSSSVAKPLMRITNETGNSFLEYVLPRSRRRGVQFRGSVSSDLIHWQSGPPHCTLAEEWSDKIIFRSAAPLTQTPRQFIRAEMIDPPGQ